MKKPFSCKAVEDVFDGYSKPVRRNLLRLRELIFDEAAKLEGVGDIEETLKWGQLSYLPSVTKSGTTIRIDKVKASEDKYALYVHCQTNLLNIYRDLYSDVFEFEKNRAVLLDVMQPFPEMELRHCIGMALTYHLNKKS
ncbi:MAG: DUF1801 domain-containing protein [Methyloligellaceae bacterium]